MMRRILSPLRILTIALVLALGLTFLTAAAMPQVDPAVKVYDFTGQMSQEEIDTLSKSANQLSTKYSMDFVVVATDDSLNKSPRQYAEQFYTGNKFGQGDNWDGIILYINMTERDVYIATSGSMVTYFYDSDVDALLDRVAEGMGSAPSKYSVPFYGGQLFLQGADAHISAGQNTTGESPLREGGAAPSNYYDYSDIPMRELYGVGPIAGMSILIGLVISGVVLLVMVLLHKRSLSSPPQADAYLDKDGLRITRQKDTFLHTHTTRSAIPKNNSSSSGGGGGGGSSHSSSGGRSFGGGGRKF